MYRFAYFFLYGSLQPMLSSNLKDNFAAKFAFGYATTVSAGLIAYPLDVITTRRQMVAIDMPHSSALACARYMIKSEGVLSLWRGAGVNIATGMFGALAISGFDMAKRWYLRSQQQQQQQKHQD